MKLKSDGEKIGPIRETKLAVNAVITLWWIKPVVKFSELC
jgi:hypothetical protein